jgi:uncharacterized repeat protein (TIGR02543 family)
MNFELQVPKHNDLLLAAVKKNGTGSLRTSEYDDWLDEDYETESYVPTIFCLKQNLNGFKSGIWTQYTVKTFSASNKYTVKFNVNGGLTEGKTYYSPTAVQTVYRGVFVAQPASPFREGYKFLGWYTDRAGSNAWNFSLEQQHILKLGKDGRGKRLLCVPI